MTLVTVDELKVLVTTPIGDYELRSIIDRVEADITAAIGEPYSDDLTLTEMVKGGGADIFVRRPIEAITTVTNHAELGDSGAAVTDYYAWQKQGRITRTPTGSTWGEMVTVTYRPTDQRSKRKAAVIDLVRIVLTQPALQVEVIPQDYSYTAFPDYEVQRRRVIRRLMFPVA